MALNVSQLIDEQCEAVRRPLVAVTMAAVPCRDTPVILTLHWHGFVCERLADAPEAATVAWRPVPSSAIQLNLRWNEVADLDHAALDAAWIGGAWDMARSERRSCLRPGAPASEAHECRQAFSALPRSLEGDDLVSLAQVRGYLTWLFRPVAQGIWKPVADDVTLAPDGRREPPCPVIDPLPPPSGGDRRTVCRLGKAGSILVQARAARASMASRAPRC
jgi:hypothetical protein